MGSIIKKCEKCNYVYSDKFSFCAVCGNPLINYHGKIKDHNISNKELLRYIKELQIENKKSVRLSIGTLGFALIAITVPIVIKLTSIPDYGQALIAIVYFLFGSFLIFEQWYRLKKERGK